jgi:hypothetical protein
MRTTLDIDDDVLERAKELARARKTTTGEVLSDLARQAMTTPSRSGPATGPGGTIMKNGWLVLPSRGGPPITNELVRRLLDEADLEDADIRPREKK